MNKSSRLTPKFSSAFATADSTSLNTGRAARLQVRITFFSFFWFIASIRLSNFGSMNGPFFNERDISAFLAYSYRFVLLRRRTIYWSVFLLRRVFLPKVGLPHGLLGPSRPIG